MRCRVIRREREPGSRWRKRATSDRVAPCKSIARAANSARIAVTLCDVVLDDNSSTLTRVLRAEGVGKLLQSQRIRAATGQTWNAGGRFGPATRVLWRIAELLLATFTVGGDMCVDEVSVSSARLRNVRIEHGKTEVDRQPWNRARTLEMHDVMTMDSRRGHQPAAPPPDSYARSAAPQGSTRQRR